MAAGFKVRALVVAMGPIQIRDVSLTRISADTLQLGSGDTMRFAVGTGAVGTESRLVLPHSTAITGTAYPANNGEVVVTQRAAGSPAIVVRLNGTNYYTALSAA